MLISLILIGCTAPNPQSLAVESTRTTEENLPKRPEQKLHWCVVPEIIVCLNSIVLEEDVVDFAFDIVDPQLANADIRFAVCSTNCTGRDNTITISGPNCLAHEATAITKGLTLATAYPGNQCIRTARIELWTTHPRVVAHEAGHSVGYSHSGRQGHLMHPSLPKGGWNTRGM